MFFLRPGRRNGVLNPPAAATSANAPNVPAGCVAAAPAAGNSFFAGGQAYFWAATAINRFGESVPVVSATQTPAVTQIVQHCLYCSCGWCSAYRI